MREDYSADGGAWAHFPHDHARSRAYRWNEDGLGGICDRRQHVCFALSLWNGRDPILKERMFGLSGPEGNHGEDVKEYWFYLDSTPTHSYMKYLYKYPQAEFPYARLVEENRRRDKMQPEFELVDTGIFDESRYFDVVVEYAKAAADDILIRISVSNRGPEAAPIEVLPTLWFRNTWSWGRDDRRPTVAARGRDILLATHWDLGEYALYCPGADELLFTENETNTERLYGVPSPTPYVKDAFHACVVNGRREAVNPAATGTKAAARYARTVGAGETVTLDLRLACGARRASARGAPRGARRGVRSSARRKRTSSTASSCLPGSLPTPGSWRARPSPGCCGPSSSTTTSSTTGWRGTRRSRARRPSAGTGATTSGRTCSPAT